jgi:hypothetical protein
MSETRTRNKYDRATLAKVRKRIAALIKTGIGRQAVAETMNKEGYAAAGGGPFTGEYVTRIAGNARQAGMRIPSVDGRRLPRKTRIAAQGPKRETKTVAPAKALKFRLPATVVGILTDPTLSDRQRVRMITAFAEL